MLESCALPQVLVHVCVQRYETKVRQQVQEGTREIHCCYLPSARESKFIFSGSGHKKVNINSTAFGNSMSSYLKASSNLKLSYVVRTQRKIQNLGSIPTLSAWILPQPRTALKAKKDVKNVNLTMLVTYHSATHFGLILVSNLSMTHYSVTEMF